MTTWIVVNRHRIARNAKMLRLDRSIDLEPPIRITNGKHGRPVYANEVAIDGPTRIVYDAGNAVLPCGARLAIATDAEVRVLR